jgi:hypothetical protein
MRGIIGLHSVVALAPILVGVFIASHFLLRGDRLSGFASLGVGIGFLAGGGVGWAFVPAQWTAFFWTTVEPAGSALCAAPSVESSRPPPHAAPHRGCNAR